MINSGNKGVRHILILTFFDLVNLGNEHSGIYILQ